MFWQSRSRDAQLTTRTVEQSAIMDSWNELGNRLRPAEEKFDERSVPRLDNLRVYCLATISIELLIQTSDG